MVLAYNNNSCTVHLIMVIFYFTISISVIYLHCKKKLSLILHLFFNYMSIDHLLPHFTSSWPTFVFQLLQLSANLSASYLINHISCFLSWDFSGIEPALSFSPMVKPGSAGVLTPYGATYKQWGWEPVYKLVPLPFLLWTVLRCALHRAGGGASALSRLRGLQQWSFP